MTERELPPDQGDITSGSVRRGARMLGIPLSHAGRATVGLTRRVLGADADEVSSQVQRATAEQIFRVLGDLKGGAMKFGQALSLFEVMLPDDMAGPYRDQLRRLQDSAAPMPTTHVHSVLATEFGADWRHLFDSFERRPVAAASIGQVHRAVWAATGEPVAVKLQYPGADKALLSDLGQLSRLASLMAPLTGSVDVRTLIAEIIERVGEEIDYEKEADHQQRAADGFAGSAEFVVPRVHAATRRAMVSDWVDGRPMSAFTGADEHTRNDLGLRYARFLFAGPKTCGLLHADPHPGNFLVTPDGRLGVVDFGLVARLPDGFPPAMGRLLTLAGRGDAEGVRRGLAKEGFVVGDVDADELLDYLMPLAEPASVPLFHFTRTWLRGQVTRVHASATDQGIAQQLNVPPVYALIHRVWVGGLAVLTQLDARADLASVLREFLDGFDL